MNQGCLQAPKYHHRITSTYNLNNTCVLHGRKITYQYYYNKDSAAHGVCCAKAQDGLKPRKTTRMTSQTFLLAATAQGTNWDHVPPFFRVKKMYNLLTNIYKTTPKLWRIATAASIACNLNFSLKVTIMLRSHQRCDQHHLIWKEMVRIIW